MLAHPLVNTMINTGTLKTLDLVLKTPKTLSHPKFWVGCTIAANVYIPLHNQLDTIDIRFTLYVGVDDDFTCRAVVIPSNKLHLVSLVQISTLGQTEPVAVIPNVFDPYV